MMSSDRIVDDLSFFECWEDRYRYMIDLGKELPAMDSTLRTDDRIIPGCQSQVWIDHQFKNDQLVFQVDSDAMIVKGLLAIVMAAYNHKSAEEILAFDIENYFGQLDLIKHLSPTRGNGLQAMVKKIKSLAQATN